MSVEDSRAFPERVRGVHSAASFLNGGGEMGALIRSIDWATTSLGPVSGWPQSLRTSVSICLSSRFPILLWWGPELVMLYNDAYRPMTGAKHPWSMGRPGLEVWAEIRDVIGPMLHTVMTTGEATWSEDLMLPLVRRESAEESYFTFTYSPIRDETGGVGGVFCAVVETTQKVIEERRLRLLNALADATQAKTPAEACVLAAAQIANSPSDVPFALLYLYDEHQRIARLAGAANLEPAGALSPAAIHLEDRSIWPFDGAPQFVDIEGAPGGVRDAVVLPIERAGGAQPLGFIVAGLSPLLRRTDSYARFHNLLSTSISQAVSNAATYQEERKRAEALADLDRAKTTFFSNVSHEFRTPLTLMLAPIQDLLAAPPGAPVERVAVELLHRNALRLLKLVNTLLEFSRIEAGRIDAVYEPVDLSALTEDLASSFRAAIERAGIEFVVDCPPLPEPVYVDRDMWEKIVLNLVSNAFKFTFEGSIAVRLQIEDDRVRLDVTDTGIGVADEEIPRLFERFHRIEGARARSHEGSGIGLALSHELVRMHGGEVGVKSQLGKGTAFSVRIPRGSAHLPEGRVRAARSLPSTAVGTEAYVSEALRWGVPVEDGQTPAPSPFGRAAESRERIVFADDNADMRDYVARILRERWTVEAVGDGVAALAAIRRAPPALVLCDVMMPRLDGFGLVRTMRAETALRAIPVIILSARAGEEEAAKGLGSGANDYIAKPFSARELLVRVASALTAGRLARETREIEDRQRANLYRHFMQAPFPIAVFKGPRHVIELANPLVLRAWGRGAEIIGLPLDEALPELRGQSFPIWLDGVFQTGVAFEGKDQLARLATGPNHMIEESYFNFVYAPLRDVDGTVEGILLSAFDVTEQVRARKASEQENAVERTARHAAELGAEVGRALVGNAPLPDQLLRCCEALVRMGAKFARIWTYSADHEALRLQASSGTYAHGDEVETLSVRPRPGEVPAELPLGAIKVRRIAAGRCAHFTNSIVGDPEVPDQDCVKREGLVSFAGYPLVIGDRLVGVAALFTERELTDAEVAGLAIVADQIALGIERYESERFRELFIGMLGHDLRNPLNAVNMATHLLLSTVSGDQHRTVARIQKSTMRMERMITQVLDFTRARTGGGIPLARLPADLAAISAQVTDELAMANPGRSIQTTFSGDARGLWDADRLAQVFSNLVSNAIAYGDPKGPVVAKLEGWPDEVRYSICNDGPRIPRELLPDLFDPFRRARHAKLAGTQGLGLGLFITKEIVKAHGGSIRVQSTDEDGTVFSVALPKVRA